MRNFSSSTDRSGRQVRTPIGSRNRITDYENPLDTPVGEHIVTELVRPLGSGAPVTQAIDLREVSFLFPLDQIPEWIAGRLFYQFLSQAIRWLITPLILLGLVAAIISSPDAGADPLQRVLVGVVYDLALLVVGFGVLFFISRRMAVQAISIMGRTPFGRALLLLGGPTASVLKGPEVALAVNERLRSIGMIDRATVGTISPSGEARARDLQRSAVIRVGEGDGHWLTPPSSTDGTRIDSRRSDESSAGSS
jgi:hypothetical protein